MRRLEPSFNGSLLEQALKALPPAQPDLSEYSDKLWHTAYERGKEEGYEQGKADGIKMCTEEIGSVFGQIFPSKERREPSTESEE